MAQFTAQTVKQMAHEIFDYEIADADLIAMANTAGAMLTLARHLGSLGLGGIEPPFGYPALIAEASRQKLDKD